MPINQQENKSKQQQHFQKQDHQHQESSQALHQTKSCQTP